MATSPSPVPKTPMTPATPAELAEKLGDRWGWFLGLGVLFVILGTVGLLMVGPLSLASVIYVAALFLIGGVMQLVHAFGVKCWRSTLWHVAGGLLYLVAGVLLLAQPVAGLLTLTLAVGVVILAAGVLRMIIGFQHRPDPGWVWILLSGVVGVGLGVMIVSGLPGNAIWVLGLLVAIELLMEGWSMVAMGFALRRWKQQEAEAPA